MKIRHTLTPSINGNILPPYIAFNNRRLDNSSVSETAIKVLNVVAGEVSSGKLKVSEIDTIDNIRTYLSKIKKLVNVTSNETI